MHLEVPASSPSPALPPLLTAAEQALLRRQIAGLRHIDALDRSHARSEWDKGDFCRRVRDRGLWRRSAEHRAASFLDFVTQVSSLRSRGAVERRLVLVEHYGREEFVTYLAAGTCATALVEITRAEDDLRPTLRELARSGLTVAEVGLLRGAGRALLAADKARPDAEERREGRLRERLLSTLTGERLLRPGRGERRRNGERAGAAPRPGDEGTSAAGPRGEDAERGHGAALETQEAEAAAERGRWREEGLGERERRISEREAALAGRGAQLDAREAALGALAGREGQVQGREAALAEREAQTEAREAALRGLADSPAAQLAEREMVVAEREGAAAAREGALAAQAEALAEREAALAARIAEIEATAQQQQAEAQELGALQQALQEDREELAFRLDRVAEDEARQQKERVRLDRDRFELFRWLSQEGRVAWPEDPWSLDATLLCAAQLLERLWTLGALADTQINVKGHLAVDGGMDVIYAVKVYLDRASERWRKALQEAGKDLKMKHPAKVADFFARFDAAKKRGAQPEPAVAERPETRPPKQFALPTRALLGSAEARSPQHGVLGLTRDRKEVVTLDMNGVQTVAIFGQQNAGKSHTILALTENALGSIAGISITPAPMAVIHCHYHPDPDSYAPGFGAALLPNDEPAGVAVLRGDLEARPQGLRARRKLVFVPPMDEAGLQRRRAELPGAEVLPLQLSARELGMEGLKLLMGAGKSASLYMMRINHALSALSDPSPEEFKAAIRGVKLSPQVRDIVEDRLRLIDRVVGEEPLGARIAPGDFVGLDMRAPWIDEAVAMALFTVSMNAFAQARVAARDSDGNVLRDEGGRALTQPFRKMMVFDEAHKYMGRGMLSADILKMVREMRHRDMWVVYASQDPESVHPALIKLSTVLIVHQLKAQSSKKVLKDNFAGCEALDVGELSQMARGEARVLAVDCADPTWRQKPQPLLIRPTCARPGGTTRPAVPAAGAADTTG